MAKRPKVFLTVKNRLRIIKMFLSLKNNAQVAKKLGVSLSTLAMYIRDGVIPSRKALLEFLVFDYLSKLGRAIEANDNIIGIKNKTIITLLNNEGLTTCTGKEWTPQNLVNLFSRMQKNKEGRFWLGKDLILLETDFYSEFLVSEESFDIEPYLKTPPSFWDVDTDEKRGELTPFYSRIKKGIEQAIGEGCETTFEVLQYLHKLGLKNQAGNKIGKWSLVKYLEHLNITLPTQPLQLKEWDYDYLRALFKKIKEYPTDEKITYEILSQMIKDITPLGFRLTDKAGLRKKVASIVKEHNANVTTIRLTNKWYPLFSKICNETYRHKIPACKEIAKELGVSMMYAHRLSKLIDFDICEPYYQSFLILCDSYEDQLVATEKPSIKGLGEFLSNTYLKSPRGEDWNYGLVRNTKISSRRYAK